MSDRIRRACCSAASRRLNCRVGLGLLMCLRPKPGMILMRVSQTENLPIAWSEPAWDSVKGEAAMDSGDCRPA